MAVMQGDQYLIPITIVYDGEDPDLEAIDRIEFAIGHTVKYYPEEVHYKEDTKEFMFPLTQEESFKMKATVPVQIRVHFTSGDVIGTPVGNVAIRDSISKRVL